jgi:hypothetical protein
MEREIYFTNTAEESVKEPVEMVLIEAQGEVVNGLKEEGVEEKYVNEFERFGLDTVVEESVEKNESSFNTVKGVFPKQFEECNSWKDVFKECGRISVEVHKEYLYVQVFAGGVILSVAQVNPFLKILGGVLINVGYDNSEFLQKILRKSDIDRVIK